MRNKHLFKLVIKICKNRKKAIKLIRNARDFGFNNKLTYKAILDCHLLMNALTVTTNQALNSISHAAGSISNFTKALLSGMKQAFEIVETLRNIKTT